MDWTADFEVEGWHNITGEQAILGYMKGDGDHVYNLDYVAVAKGSWDQLT